jgi:hypothetical protein
MTYRSKLIVTVALLLVLGGIGAADMLFSNDGLEATLPMPSGNTPLPTEQLPPTDLNQPQNPGQGVARHVAANVNDALIELGFTVQPSDDRSMLEQVVDTSSMTVTSLVILKDGDRIGAVVWVESPEVKSTFLSLKEALLAAFSPQVKDLSDETKIDPGLPIRNVLTFLDPTLSEERLTFVRVGERLMEFHTVAGKEAEMQTAIDGLSKL